MVLGGSFAVLLCRRSSSLEEKEKAREEVKEKIGTSTGTGTGACPSRSSHPSTVTTGVSV